MPFGLNLEPHTLRTYRSHAELHIIPLIGAELLSQMTTPKIAAFRDTLIDTISRAMAKKVLASLKSIFNEAQGRGLIAQNVAKPVSVSSASRHKKSVRIPTKADVRLILTTAKELTNDPQAHIAKAWRRYHPFLMTAVTTGMRASELRGLYWSAVDFKNNIIKVNQRADENGLIGPVKSGAGRRNIAAPPILMLTLKEWRLLCPAGDLVFPNWQGNVETHANLTRRCWYSVCERCGLADVQRVETGKNRKASKRISPHFTLHSLRHFHASMLIANGATPKEVQVEMGHSSIQVTFDIYGHLFPDDEAQRVQRAAALEAQIIG